MPKELSKHMLDLERLKIQDEGHRSYQVDVQPPLQTQGLQVGVQFVFIRQLLVELEHVDQGGVLLVVVFESFVLLEPDHLCVVGLGGELVPLHLEDACH